MNFKEKLTVDLKNKETWPLIVTTFTCIVFLLITTIAMFFYQGSTYIDHNTIGYRFFENYFSDLGHTFTRSETTPIPNTISSVLFTIGVLIGGLGLIPFFIVLQKYFSDTPRHKRMSQISSVFGVIVAIGYIGIGFTPVNLLKDLHTVFVIFSFISTFPLLLCYGYLMYKNDTIPKYLSYLFFALATISFFYIIQIIVDYTPGVTWDITLLTISVTFQKIIIYMDMISIAIVGHGMAKYVSQK